MKKIICQPTDPLFFWHELVTEVYNFGLISWIYNSKIFVFITFTIFSRSSLKMLLCHYFYVKINASFSQVKKHVHPRWKLCCYCTKKIKPCAKNIQQCGYLNISQSKHVYVIYFFTLPPVILVSLENVRH